MSSNELDLQKLCQIFDLTKPPEERKQLDALFNIYKTLPKFGPSLLTIACRKEGTLSNEICFGAAIQLKNYINANWKFTEDNNLNNQLVFNNETIIIISQEDKNFIRKNILDGIKNVIENENVQILKQFTQCVKKILKCDYKDIWRNDFLKFVIDCINSQNQKIIYAGIILFYQLSKIYEFEDDENQEIYCEALNLVNDKFIYYVDMCKNMQNNVEALILYKLFKIFLKNFQGSVPHYIISNIDVYRKWSNYLILILKTPLNNQYINDTNSIFWKLKRVCFQIISRVTQKYKNRQTNNKLHNTFRQNYYKEFIPQYYDIFIVIYTNINNNQQYIDDYGKFCVYNFLYFLLENAEYKEKIIKLFCENDLLLDEIIKDCIMPKSDLEAWVDSPKEYIGQKEEELSMFNTKKFRAMKLIYSFMEYKEKKSKKYLFFDRIYNYLCNSIIKDEQNLIEEENKIKTFNLTNPKRETYLTEPSNIPFCLKKESIFYILKKNYEVITKNADTDLMIQKLVLPSLQSPCGLLREQSCHLLSRFKIKNEELLIEIIKRLCYLMENDMQLQVRLYACLALGNVFDNEKARNMMKGSIQNILQISLKLMEETDIEDIMYILQKIVKYFTNESQQYIKQLSDYLINYFDKIVEKEKHMEDDEKYVDYFSLKENIVSTFTSFIKFFISHEQIYSNIINHIDKLINYFLTESDTPELGMDLIEEILKDSPIPNPNTHVLKFFIPLIQSVIGTEEELNEFKNNFKGQVFEGQGYESILDVSKIVCTYIAKDPNSFIKLTDEKGVGYIVYAIKLIESIIHISESKGDYEEAKYCLGIIMTLFDLYKGQMDKLMTDLIEFVSIKLKNNKITDKNLIRFLLNIISICFIYDPIKTLNLLQNKNITEEIFVFWFSNLKQLDTKTYIKYNLIAICSIIKIDFSQQDKLIMNNINQIIESIFFLTEKLNNKIEKEFEEQNCEYEEYEDDIDEKNTENENNENNIDNNKLQEQVNNIISGEPNFNYINKDEEIYEDEVDEDDEPLTEFDKINTIGYVKNTLNEIAKNQEMAKIITESLGNKYNILNDIFNKEEQRINSKKKNN